MRAPPPGVFRKSGKQRGYRIRNLEVYTENGRQESKGLGERQVGAGGMRYTQNRVVRNSLIVKLFVGIPFEWNGKVLKCPGLDWETVATA